MNNFLLIVEPLRVRATHRWLERQGVLLVCSRVFAPLPPAPRVRASRDKAPAPTAPNLLHSLHRPGSFRGRAMSPKQLISSCPAIEAVKEGDRLVVPHLPARGGVSIHVVGAGGLVAGSSATSALPLGFVISRSEGLLSPLLATLQEREALIAELPFPTGPITPLSRLPPKWDAALSACV